MVTVKDYHVRKRADETTFVTLELSGSLEMVQSQNTGKFYATMRSCSIATTFDEATAKELIGTSLDGNILKQECTPYNYTIESTGEVVQLNYTYGYEPASPVRSTMKQISVDA